MTATVGMASSSALNQPENVVDQGAGPEGSFSVPASSLSDSDGDQTSHRRMMNGSHGSRNGSRRNLESHPVDAPRVRGRVKWFNYHKGFGFITMDDEDDEVFVHQSNIKFDGFRSLREEEEVEFDLVIGEDGKKKAFNVTGPDGRPPQGVGEAMMQHLHPKMHRGMHRGMYRGMNMMNVMMNVPSMSGLTANGQGNPLGATALRPAGPTPAQATYGNQATGNVSPENGTMSPDALMGAGGAGVGVGVGVGAGTVADGQQQQAAGAAGNMGTGQQAYYGQMQPMFYQQAYYQLNESGYPQAYPMSPTHGGHQGYGGYNPAWYGGPRMPPPGVPGYSSGLQIVVHNLPWDCSWQELRTAFQDIGPIERADVVFDSHGRSRGFGIVRFASREAAQLAVEKMNDATISGRVVSVRLDRFA